MFGKLVKRIVNISILLLFILVSFQAMAFAGDVPVLEHGRVNNSSDGITASGASAYLKVVGQNKVYDDAVVVIDDGSSSLWNGNVWFDDGTGPDAGQQHIVVIEKQVEDVGYYALTTKTLSPEDINNPDGVQFPTVTLAKMYAPLGMVGSNKVGLAIANIIASHHSDSLWGYRVYRQVDGGPWEHMTDVSLSDAVLFMDNSVNADHSYKYKYRILTFSRYYKYG